MTELLDASPPTTTGSSLRDSKGWDGKLRLDKKAVVSNAEILSDPEYSDEDAPPVEQISADEGMYSLAFPSVSLISAEADLLEDYELDTDVRCAGGVGSTVWTVLIDAVLGY